MENSIGDNNIQKISNLDDGSMVQIQEREGLYKSEVKQTIGDLKKEYVFLGGMSYVYTHPIKPTGSDKYRAYQEFAGQFNDGGKIFINEPEGILRLQWQEGSEWVASIKRKKTEDIGSIKATTYECEWTDTERSEKCELLINEFKSDNRIVGQLNEEQFYNKGYDFWGWNKSIVFAIKSNTE